MKIRTWLAAPIAIWAAIVPVRPAHAVDYRAEIIMNVVDPCILAVVRKHADTRSLSDDDITRVVKAATRGSLNRMMQTAIPIVEGRKEEDRQSFYAESLAQCISTDIGNPTSQTTQTACTTYQPTSTAAPQTVSRCLK